MENRILKVSQINQYIKRVFDQDYILQNAFVEGEISNYKLHSSGHAYFSLKDADASIACVLFRGSRTHIGIDLVNGMKIVVKGNISVYERDGRYQIYVKDVSDAGLGLLHQKFELLKKECAAKGYFDDSRKRSIPKYPFRIGIVTSPTGAAIQDIINISKRRNPFVQLVLYPALVQGPNAYKTVVEGITYFNQTHSVDVIIIGRGGGSLEDLWAFNEKAVIEAMVASDIPIISGVGHETDFTLADFASDLRAPTPSAAAELAVFDYESFMILLDIKQQTLDGILGYKIESLSNQLKHLTIQLSHLSPQQSLLDKQNRLLDLKKQLKGIMDLIIQNNRNQLALLEAKLMGLSPTSRLVNGYGYITKEGIAVKSIKGLKVDDQVQIVLNDGQFESKITMIEPIEQEADHGK